MNRFFPGNSKKQTRNNHGNIATWIFVSNRLAKLIDAKGFNWFHPWFKLKRFELFDGDYSAVMMSSTGAIILIKNTDDTHFRNMDDL